MLRLDEALLVDRLVDQCEGLHDGLVVINGDYDRGGNSATGNGQRVIGECHILNEGREPIPNSGKRQCGHRQLCIRANDLHPIVEMYDYPAYDPATDASFLASFFGLTGRWRAETRSVHARNRDLYKP